MRSEVGPARDFSAPRVDPSRRVPPQSARPAMPPQSVNPATIPLIRRAPAIMPWWRRTGNRSTAVVLWLVALLVLFNRFGWTAVAVGALVGVALLFWAEQAH